MPAPFGAGERLQSPTYRYLGGSNLARLPGHEIPNIITERVDDILLLLEQMQRRWVCRCRWTGLSLGWVSTIWLSSILSRGDHHMVHVEPCIAKRLWTLGVTTVLQAHVAEVLAQTCNRSRAKS